MSTVGTTTTTTAAEVAAITPLRLAAAIATAAAVTAAVVGSMVNTLPPSCQPIVANGVTYQKCGGTYYQPQFSGGNTSYVVVNQP